MADGISDAFRFDFAGTPVNTGLLFVLRRVQIYIVQLCVCDFMYRRFQGLNLAHALVNGNALVLQMVVAMRATRYLLKADRNRGSLFKGSEKIPVTLHVACQFVNGNVGKLFPLGLGNVENRHYLVGGYRDFLFLRNRLPVFPNNRLLRVGVDFLHFLFDFVRRRGNDFNSLLPFHHVSPKIVFPCGKARHKGSVRLLHGDKQRIVKAVIMKF